MGTENVFKLHDSSFEHARCAPLKNKSNASHADCHYLHYCVKFILPSFFMIVPLWNVLCHGWHFLIYLTV